MIEVHRYHDLSCGHRVVGHENKCRWLHGHNYRVHFHCTAPSLDTLGRVIDFGIIKSKLCDWLERHWDHKMLLWDLDPYADALLALQGHVGDSIVLLPFNPTAENMACYLLHDIGPAYLSGTSVTLHRVVVEETRKCSAAASIRTL